MRRLKLLLILPIALILSSCTEVELASHVAKKIGGTSQNQGTFKVGKPYKIFDKWYSPTEDYDLVETGIASWYGPNFHGKSTANGETFNQNELTAAHRTLQMPSMVRVTNLENGRSIIVRVNDRGPFKRGRIIDLSKRAAELLDYKNKGTAKVRLQVLNKESRAIAEIAKRGESTKGSEIALNKTGKLPAHQQAPLTRPTAQQSAQQQTAYNNAPTAAPPQQPQATQAPQSIQSASLKPVERLDLSTPETIVKTIPVPDTGIYVQAASFGSPDNAARYAKRLSQIGDTKVIKSIVNGREMHRVRFGPLKTVDNADILLARLAETGHGSGIIIVE